MIHSTTRSGNIFFKHNCNSGNKASMKQQVKKVIKNSLYKSQNGLPSYKLDGAKLIVNRLKV